LINAFVLVSMMEPTEHILIAGGSGAIGHLLRSAFEAAGHRVTALTRSKVGPGYAKWDPAQDTIDVAALAEATVLINLAGEQIAPGRWTDSRKKRIRESRTQSTTFLAWCLKNLPNHIHTVINASAVGYYGDSGSTVVDESSPPGEGFMGTTCVQWEKAANSYSGKDIRVLIVRMGIILDKQSGFLSEILKPAHLGIIPLLGSGRQYMSWIHPADLSGIMLHLIRKKELSGVFNTSSPDPVTMSQMAAAIKSALHSRAVIVKVPALFLQLALGEVSATVITGQRASSEKIIQSGYKFQYGHLGGVLNNLLNG